MNYSYNNLEISLCVSKEITQLIFADFFIGTISVFNFQFIPVECFFPFRLLY